MSDADQDGPGESGSGSTVIGPATAISDAGPEGSRQGSEPAPPGSAPAVPMGDAAAHRSANGWADGSDSGSPASGRAASIGDAAAAGSADSPFGSPASARAVSIGDAAAHGSANGSDDSDSGSPASALAAGKNPHPENVPPPGTVEDPGARAATHRPARRPLRLQLADPTRGQAAEDRPEAWGDEPPTDRQLLAEYRENRPPHHG